MRSKMCKRLHRLTFVIFLCVLFSVTAFALPPNSFVGEDGNTHLETVDLRELPADTVEYFLSVFEEEKGLILSSGSNYIFLVIPESYTLSFTRSSNGVFAQVMPITGGNPLRYLTFTKDGEYYTLLQDNYYAGVYFDFVVGGRYAQSATFPDLGFNYIADFPGEFLISYIVSDVGKDGILNWLGNFWQTLADTIKGLFVPSDDYFKSFFDEIKSAFDKKLGGLSEFVNSISESFSALKNVDGLSSFTITLPNNQFFYGYDGITVDILAKIKPLLSFLRGLFNSILVVSTCVFCYRRLIEIIKT